MAHSQNTQEFGQWRGPFHVELNNEPDNQNKGKIFLLDNHGDAIGTAVDEQIANVFAASSRLLAYAECEAAYNAPKATFSTINVVLRKHGWTDAHDRRAWMADLRDAALAKARGQQ